MTYKQFVTWIDKNCPEGIDPDDLVEWLASQAADICEVGAERKGIPVNEFVLSLVTPKIESFYTH